jgi:predicted amidohydrolase YtcJ
MNREHISGMIDAIAHSGLERGGLGDDTLRIVGIKTVNENTLTAEPEWDSERLKDVLLEIAKKEVRFSVHSHCGMNQENLRLFQQVNERYPIKKLRWLLVHQNGTTPEMIQINKDLGLVVNHDLGFAYLAKPEQWFKMFGFPKYPDRLIFPIPLWLKAGVPFSLSTDGGAGNTVPSIWASVFVACTRKTWPQWGGEYAIARKEALMAITMGGAYKLGMEKRIGSIEAGKRADLAVLSADPLTCRDEQLKAIRAKMTIVDGNIVYESK